MAGKTIEEAHELLDKFNNGMSVGKLIYNKSLEKRYVVEHESTIKLRELRPEEREFLTEFIRDWDALSVEIISSGTGEADRVKIKRAFT